MDYGLGLIAQGITSGLERRSQEKAERERLERERAMEQQRIDRENRRFNMQMRNADRTYGLQRDRYEAEQERADQNFQLQQEKAERDARLADVQILNYEDQRLTSEAERNLAQQEADRSASQRETINRLRRGQMAARAGDYGPMAALVSESLGVPVELSGVQGNNLTFASDAGEFQMTEQDINEFIALSPEEWIETLQEVDNQRMNSVNTNPERFIPGSIDAARANNDPSLLVPRQIGSEVFRRQQAILDELLEQGMGRDDDVAGVTDGMSSAERREALVRYYLPFANSRLRQEMRGFLPEQTLDILLGEDSASAVGIPQQPTQQPQQRPGRNVLDRMFGDVPLRPQPGIPQQETAMPQQETARRGSRNNPIPITNVNQNQLVEGMHYMTDRGVFIWNGQRLVKL